MNLCLFIITFIFSLTDIEPVNEENSKIINIQLDEYIVEFEETSSSYSAWSLYILLNNRFIDIDFIFDNYHNDNYQNISKLLTCIEDIDNKFIDRSFLFKFTYCLDNPDINISYLYDNNGLVNNNMVLLNKLKENNLTNKQKYHYNYLSDSHTGEKYHLSSNDPNILDFYFFDHIYRNHYHHAIEIPLNWTEHNYNNLSSSTNTAAYYLISINALYKLQQRYDILKLANSLNNFNDLPISLVSLRIMRYISFSSYYSGFYQSDINLNRNLLIPLSKFFSIEEQMKAKLDFGVSLYSMGNLKESLRYLEEVYDNIEHLNDFRYQSALLNNLGIVYYNTGYFENYIQLIIKALDFAKKNNDVLSEIHYLNNLHIYHKKIDNWQTSLEYLEQVHKKAEEIGDNRRLSIVNQSYGTFYRDFQNDFEKAEIHFAKAKELATIAEDYRLIITILSEFSDTYLKNGNYEKALLLTMQLYEEAKSRNDKTVLVHSFAKLANIHFAIGEFDLAENYIDSLQNSDISSIRFLYQSLANTVIAKYNFFNDQNEEGLDILQNFAKEALSRIRHSSEVQSGLLLLESEYISLFSLLIRKLIEFNHWNEAFYWMDEIKNLSTTSFYNNPALKSSILSENELILDFALRNRIDRLRSEILVADQSQRVQLNNQLLEAISEQNILRRKVLQNIDLESVNLNRLRRQLGRSDIILYFSMFDNHLFASTITSGTVEMQRLEFSSEDQKRIDALVESLSSDRVPLLELEWIRTRIIDELDIPDRYTNYMVVPDGFLYHIPLEILPLGNVASNFSYGETKYLIEHASVSYENSLKDLERSLYHTPKRNHNLDFLGIGISHFDNSESQILPGRILPPLPLAEKEVTDIARILTKLSDNAYLLSHDGTEKEFRKNAGSSRILHLASHSEVFENDPLYSLIYLNPTNDPDNILEQTENDGLIYAYELFDMDLSNEMVMLNSCESGSGNYIQGSGIIGFSRAFNYAGVQSLILNLWSVRDRSAYEMSVSFYHYLNEGLGKQEAMRKAKIDYINNINSNPSNWGSFVVYGNVDPIVRSHNPWIIGSILLFLGFISIAAAWLRYYNRFPLHRL